MRRRNHARKSRLRAAVVGTVAAAGSAGLLAGALYAVQPPDRSGGRQATLTGEQAAKLDRRAADNGRRGVRGGTPGAGNGAAAALAVRLADRLGERTAGSYLDSAGRPVVTVTNASDAAMVRRAGAVPKTLERGPASLNRMTAALRRSTSGVPGTGWAVDPATSKVTVWTDDSVTGTRMAAVRRATAGMGTAVRMVRIPGRLRTLALGGDAIFGQGIRCSLGFNVTRGGADFFLTAGHCGNEVRAWTADQQGAEALGTTVQSSFPGNDFALVQADAAGEGSVNLYNGQAQDITEAGEAVVGQEVARSGSTTGVHTGNVTATNATVNFPEGTVTGMIQTTVCAEPGDSGGPLFAGSTALGLTSGGSGDCQSGGVTFFQPVTEPLQAFDAEVS
ncbi:S1 family peptidase [Actinomadura decatromicini]|uniref:S1 family peptidase n=1 Tax=Actinomadura decatromicini TaxID=2604572 RepID=A0A5D3F5D7_9ACTN|nr:S1 family peptidase [Actinomadura decatromicini]TYK43128.1 S1 family peptidase [Actinomadura decatromicini]